MKNIEPDSSITVLDQQIENGQGRVMEREVNGVKVVLTHKSSSQMAELEIPDGGMTQLKKDSLLGKYDKYLYFTLSYSREGKELLSTVSDSRQHFNQVQDILTFKMRDYVTLLHGANDTIDMVDYNFARTYGMSRSSTLLFVFDRTKLAKADKKLHFNIKDIEIGIGDLSFSMPVPLIKNTSY